VSDSLTIPVAPHSLSPAEAAAVLRTDSENGLSNAEAQRRLAQFGPNQLDLSQPISALRIFFRQFQDLMVLILAGAATVAVGAWALEGAHGLPADAIVIGAILVLNACLGFVQEYRAEKTMQKLQEVAAASQLQVVREGRTLEADRLLLVPGDLLKLDEGDRVPADCILVRSDRLRVDESLLTGESAPVPKLVGAVAADASIDARRGTLYAGTTVTAGSAQALVAATANHTELGHLARTLATTEAEETPLQRRLAQLGKQIGWGVLLIALVVGGTILLIEGRTDLPTLTRVLMFSVALAVAAVPEGLPAVMTVSLAVGTRRLAEQRAVVRKMAAVETLGSLTVIATDKTGTITHNQMTARSLYVDGEVHDVSGEGYEAGGEIAGSHGATLLRLLQAIALANSGELVEKEGRRHAIGDPVDAGLLVLAEKGGIDWRALRRESREFSREPFSSDRARMSSVRALDGNCRLVIKGSLEALLARSQRLRSGAVEVALDAEQRSRLLAVEQEYAGQALRVLAVAEKEAVPDTDSAEQESELVLLGLVALGDPPRKEAQQAIQQCRDAGIRVVMATGDHPATAAAIARQVGLAAAGEAAITGPELEAMSEAEAQAAIRACNVFARVSPAAKLRLVDTLLQQGEVVAMTGDGVNDAPALKKVHVGVAMGSGTAVAVEASQVVLLDDNFATIVRAVKGGRRVYRSVQKFISFLFSGNFGVVLAMFLGAVFAGIFQLTDNEGLLLPLTAAQILWMNLAVDGAPAVAFSLSQSREDVMADPPRSPESPLLTRDMWLYLAFCGSFIAFGLLAVLDVFFRGGFLTLRAHDADYARSAAFYFVVCARLCNAFNFRHLPESIFTRHFFADFWVPGACLLSWCLTLLVFALPAARALFGIVPLEPATWLALTLLAPLVVVPGELYKRVFPLRMSVPRTG
jgi:P-type Ca2+ transporter type 2C